MVGSHSIEYLHADDIRLGQDSRCCRLTLGLQRCTGDAAVACWSGQLHRVSSLIPRRPRVCERRRDISREPTLRAALQTAPCLEQFSQYRAERKHYDPQRERERRRCHLPLPCGSQPLNEGDISLDPDRQTTHGGRLDYGSLGRSF